MCRMRLTLICLVLVVCGLASAAPGATTHESDPALHRIELWVERGEVSVDEGRLLALQRALRPERLPRELRELAVSPLHCATPVVREALHELDQTEPGARAQIEALLKPRRLQKTAGYLSPSGRFSLEYEVGGPDAVPAEDTTPANGIPDFVERVALFLDQSWQKQIDELGFVAPEVGGAPYQVGFESMGSYGYTTISESSPGGTRIVMNNDFLGFPANDDPEGNAIGAAKVTAAHEFKHAVQYATSQWSEVGLWPELDATWVEDIVFDAVNDYYTYLSAGSPIVAPASSLALAGGGSYPDCVFQHWISETWDEFAIVELWQRRADAPAENMIDSYEWLFQRRGSSFDEAWIDFASWNYASGPRALSGFGYEEASGYPNSTVAQIYASIPAEHSSVVDRLAAEFTEFRGFADESGQVRLVFQRALGSPIDVAVLVLLDGGDWSYRRLELAGPDETVLLAENLSTVESVVVIAANGSTNGSHQAYSVRVEEEILVPEPALQLDVTDIAYSLPENETSTFQLLLANVGQPGSTLEYRATLVAALPPETTSAKNVTGSLVTTAAGSYEPGTTADLFFSVTNSSPDFEWLRMVQVTFPAGVQVVSSTDLTGGSAGDLVSKPSAEGGSTVAWIDANGSWGNIKGGETATAHVVVQFAPSLFGDLEVDWTVYGDGYGGDPHEVSGVIPLQGPPSPLVRVLDPAGEERWPLQESVDIRWQIPDSPSVSIELSRDGGNSWEILTPSTPNDGTWTWTVSGEPTANGLVRVRSSDLTLEATSAAPFWIYQGLDWGTARPSSGSVPVGESALVFLDFDSTGLGVGEYSGVLVLEHNGSGTRRELPVVLRVALDATDNVPMVGRTALLGNAPNPFNPVTKIQFELAETAAVRLDVYDTRGQHLRRLADRTYSAGEHFLWWNGQDDGGRKVASGSYLYVLRTGGITLQGKMTLVK